MVSTQQVADTIMERHSLEIATREESAELWRQRTISAVMRATLTKVLTKEALDRMIPMQQWTPASQNVIDDYLGIPWSVTRLGCRAEYLFGPNQPKNGTEAHDAMDSNSSVSCICMR